MELNNHDTHTTGGVGFFANMALLLLTGLLHWAQYITADSVYTWVFRGLSLLSVCIVIYINWPKAVEQYKKRKTKKHGR